MLDTILIGGVAGGVGRTLVAPIDRVKIIYQSNVSTPFTWKGAFLKLVEIKQKEGVYGLWKGNTSALTRIIPYEAIKFKVYIATKDIAPNKLFAGMLSGISGEICTYPIETLRTCISYKIGKKDSYYNIINQMGIRKLYRGVSPAILSSAVYNGLSFGVYEYWRDVNSNIAAILAGITSTIGCYPMEIVKRRRQVGLKACPIDIYYKEGISAFYKCITFNSVKSAILMSVVYKILEYDKKFN